MALHARRGLILDLDDTLYPRARFVQSGLAAVAQYVAGTHGIPSDAAFAVLSRAHGSGHAGLELQLLCDRFGLPAALIPTLVDVIRTHTPSLFLSAASRETLEQLRATGWSLAVVTNGLPSVQFRKIAALRLTPLVDDVIYAEEHAAGGKPSAAPFRAALRSLELPADACICVGDDPARDVKGARRLGMRTIRLARPGVAPSRRDDADVVIEEIRQLPAAAGALISIASCQPDAPHAMPRVPAARSTLEVGSFCS
jgi:putative hydrolase of the HAD superfamily